MLSLPLVVRCGRTSSSRSRDAPPTGMPVVQDDLPRACGCSRRTRDFSPSASVSGSNVVERPSFPRCPGEREVAHEALVKATVVRAGRATRAPARRATRSGGTGADSVLASSAPAMTCVRCPSMRSVTCCPAMARRSGCADRRE